MAGRGVWIGAFALGAVSAGALAASGGNVVAAVVPTVAVAAVWAMLRVPLRWTMSALLFGWLALDQTQDADGVWHTPLYRLGDFFGSNLGLLLHVNALKFNGMELIAFLLLGLIVYRRGVGSRIDSEGQEPTAAVLRDFVLVWLTAVVVLCVWGLANGATIDVVIWHARPTVAYALLFVLFAAAYRGRADQVAAGRIIVGAACAKSLLAIWIMWIARPTIRGEPLPYATNHWDSVLFALAAIIVITTTTEQFDKRRLLRLAAILPLLLCGMIANNRRLVWVELGMTLAIIVAVSPWYAWKRSLVRGVIVMAPIVAIYIGAGWGSTSGIFKPVQTLRTLTDSKVDRSTWDRDVENWNLVLSIRDSSWMLGRGFGREYTEYIVGDDISKAFPMYKALPHNSILGWLLFGGFLGFTALWLLFAVGIFLAARAYHRASDPVDRATALSGIGAIFVNLVQSQGDLGIGSWQARILVPVALVFIGKLAVRTGAWPRRAPKAARAPAGAMEPA